jgi:hypothetical protein
MNWTDFFLICFGVGVTFSVISLLAGSMHLHWPHFHVHFGAGGHAPAGGHSAGRGGASPVNVGTVAAFLAWFGGAGYLISRYSSAWFVIALGGALVSGFLGAAIVFLFLARVLMRRDETLDPADYEMVGVLGKVSSRIGALGTGEMIFSQAGARRAAPARSDNGAEIPKGMEVVVTRYERGIAYVRPWEELNKLTAQNRETL